MHVFIHAACGSEIDVEHDLVRDGASVTCTCQTKGSIYIDADDEGFAYADVSWERLTPEALEVFDRSQAEAT